MLEAELHNKYCKFEFIKVTFIPKSSTKDTYYADDKALIADNENDLHIWFAYI